MIGITLGDPAGIGPEIVAKAIAKLDCEHLILIGSKKNFLRLLSDLKLQVPMEDLRFVDVPGDVVDYGRVQVEAGRIALKSIEKGVELAHGNGIDALATAPISKEAIRLAGSEYIDHTTMLGALTRAKRVSTVFEVGSLRILFMTKHVSLLEACRQVTKERVYDSILEAGKCLELLGTPRRKIAIAALNPHSGEGGLLGREEIEQIAPAVAAASKLVEVEGPYPADSVFHRASSGEFDIVVSMYHDQGHIASKMLDFYNTVSMNLGMFFLRTSVDHGTAFDVAGKGVADETSMLAAIDKAEKYGKSYREKYRQVFSEL